MKAEQAKRKPEFVPVIVTLESQEEVDSLHAVTNHMRITDALPALSHWWDKLTPFVSNHRKTLWERLRVALH